MEQGSQKDLVIGRQAHTPPQSHVQNSAKGIKQITDKRGAIAWIWSLRKSISWGQHGERRLEAASPRRDMLWSWVQRLGRLEEGALVSYAVCSDHSK